MSATLAERQRWAVLAGTKRRTDADEAELQALIRRLRACGHDPCEPCKRAT